VQGVSHDPSLTDVNTLQSRFRNHQATVVVAVGGGSVIDAAKAAAAAAPFTERVEPFFHGERTLPGPGLPLVAVPTTAGTGAEITMNAVLSDPDARVKKSLRSPFMVPAAAVVDPDLTLSMPPDLTRDSGIDAFTQAVEARLSTAANPVSDALATQAAGLIYRHLPRAVADGSDPEAREGMAMGSLLSAMAFSQSGLGAVHGLAHPLGHLLDLPHGYVCGVLLPHVLAWNEPVCEAPLRDLARALGLGHARDVVPAVRRFTEELGLPRSLAADGLGREHIQHTVATCRSGSMRANPRPMSDADVREFLRQLGAQP
jgi:alcohol dehydrogenase class IV